MAENFLNLKKVADNQVQESNKSSKQDEPKETYTKIYHN